MYRRRHYNCYEFFYLAASLKRGEKRKGITDSEDRHVRCVSRNI